jgi:hypothetical protein
LIHIVLLQSISGVIVINPVVAFYDIHGGKREMLFFYFVPDTTRDHSESTLSSIKDRVKRLINNKIFLFPGFGGAGAPGAGKPPADDDVGLD